MVDLSEFSAITNVKKLALSMYECPNFYKTETRSYRDVSHEEKFYIPIHFMIIGGYFRNSVVLSYKFAGSNPFPIKVHSLFLDVSLTKLKELRFLMRNDIYKAAAIITKRTRPIIRRISGKEGTIQRNHSEADMKVLGYLVREESSKISMLLLLNIFFIDF